jgi:cardiolipin synthase
MATRRLYRGLLRSGVQIYELREGILHAKAAVVDGTIALIGSFNLDPLSLTNLEALVRIDDDGFGRQVEAWIQSRIGRSIPISAAEGRWTGGLRGSVLDTLGLWVHRTAIWLSGAAVIAPRGD